MEIQAFVEPFFIFSVFGLFETAYGQIWPFHFLDLVTLLEITLTINNSYHTCPRKLIIFIACLG